MNSENGKMTNEQVKEKLQETTEKFAKEKKEQLVIDIDEAVKEEKAQAVIVKFEGEEFRLPASAPAWLIKYYSGGEEVLDDEQNLQIITNLLGKEFADKVMDDSNNFVSFELINNKVLTPVMEHWGLLAKDTEGDKKKNLTPET